MYWLAIYFVALCIAAGVFHRRGWFRLDHRSLASQPLFWAGIAVPAVSFIFFGFFVWTDRNVDFSSNGFSEFVSISKLPLALLSLSIPFSAIIANAHRATQTASQIEVALKKNALDGFLAHEKSFIEKIKSLDFGSTAIFNGEGKQEKIIITTPHTLYRKVYSGASARLDADYSVDPHFENLIRIKLKGISNILWEHIEGIDKTEQWPTVGDNLECAYVILFMTYEVFDYLGIGNISYNYCYKVSEKKTFQLNIGSEQDFKNVLRILLSVASSVIDIASSTPLTDIHGIERYAFSAHPYFLPLGDLKRVTDLRARTWRETVKVHKHS